MFLTEKIAKFSLDENEENIKSAIELFITRPHIVDKRLSGAVILNRFLSNDDITKLQIQETFPHDVNLGLTPKSNESKKLTLKRKLILKKNAQEFEDFVQWSESSLEVCFVPIVNPDEGYRISYKNGNLEFFGSKKSPTYWLEHNLGPKLVQWSQEGLISSQGSLTLVSLDNYVQKYQSLKDKYFDKILSFWDAESTNPEKFIHEDLGIAAYLLTFWHENSFVPKSFVDLGCGNGLLVYLLHKEGIPNGVGLDLRDRKIWNHFRKDGTDLRIETIEAKADDHFKDYDWLIGNHSDELTPWIPVMAKMCSSNYFVLPCCAFDFFGKFQRISQRKSQYRDYLDRILKIGQDCGFKVEEDKLRIPSTKRTCFIGIFQQSPNPDFIQELQNQSFRPRNVIEPVKNCTQVPKSIRESIVKLIFEELLELSTKSIEWNSGGKLHLGELSKMLNQKNLLTALKNECGGLQTLLRNHNHIFIVLDKGFVRLRNPLKDHHDLGKKNPSKNSAKFKQTKPCWFYSNHPQGCPANDCFWLHPKNL